jgi:hypothetical protein
LNIETLSTTPTGAAFVNKIDEYETLLADATVRIEEVNLRRTKALGMLQEEVMTEE